MKTLFILAILLLSFTFAQAQGELAPLQEKEFSYNNWTYKSISSDQSINMSEFAKDKKLVMVVYFSAWCPNWRNEAPVAQRLFEKYKDKGFGVVGVSEYDTLENTRKDLEKKNITFPVVYESVSTQDREKTLHYGYRKEAGDTRKWGSPWNVFITPAKMKREGDTLVKKAFVVNGELIEAEVEKFVRENLGLNAEETAARKIQ